MRLRRPTPEAIAALLGSEAPFSYDEVGATREIVDGARPPVPAGYDFDHHAFDLGTGRDRFERAREALRHWRQLELPWLEFHGTQTPVVEGAVVASLVSVLGFWFLSPCRVVYDELDGEDVAAYAYGTLAGHAERGEERFRLAFDPETKQVTYEISAFSRPDRLAVRIGYPLARRLQQRFAQASVQALRDAVG